MEPCSIRLPARADCKVSASSSTYRTSSTRLRHCHLKLLLRNTETCYPINGNWPTNQARCYSGYAYLWFLLHYQDQKSEISSDKCIKKLLKFSNEYKKGTLSEEEKDVLAKNKEVAVERAKKLMEDQNPSSTVYKLLEKLKG